MDTCFQHESIQRNCSLIPEMRDDVTEIKTSLLGTMDKPGWIGRIADLEKTARIFARVMWGILGTIGLAIGGSLLSLILK